MEEDVTIMDGLIWMTDDAPPSKSGNWISRTADAKHKFETVADAFTLTLKKEQALDGTRISILTALHNRKKDIRDLEELKEIANLSISLTDSNWGSF